MSLSRIVFHVQDPEARPIAGALVSGTSTEHGFWQGLTDGAGDFVANLSPGHYGILVSAPGFKERTLPADLADPGTVTIGLDREASSAHIQIRGIDFVDASGARMVYSGTDQFCAYRQFLDMQDLGPLFQESKELGFNLWRVFLMGSKAQNGILQLSPADVGYYEHLRPFADLLSSHGIMLLATVFVDAQDIAPSALARQSHWAKVAGILRGSATLLSGGNEWQKNGFNPGELFDPAMIWSRGSDLGDAAPYQPYGTFAEFHPRRDLPAALMDTVASPVFIHGTNGLTGPLIIDEPPRMGLDGSGPEYATPEMCYKFARHYATECGAAVFHSRPGQQGRVMDPTTRACAEAWQRGMRL